MKPMTAELREEATIANATPENHEEDHHLEWIEFARIGLVAIAAVLAWTRAVPLFYGFDLVSLAAMLIGGYPVFEEAVSNLLSRRMTMELSMTIALIAALAIRENFTALIILLFVLIAEMLEELTVDRGRRAIQTLLDLMPKRALVRRDGTVADLPIAQVQPGDIVVVKPGAEIPVDGAVEKRIFIRRSIEYHRRVRPCRESGRSAGLCGYDQSFRIAGHTRREAGPGHGVRQDC